jgi:hypothetical protein
MPLSTKTIAPAVNEEPSKPMERPRICGIDLPKEAAEPLENKGYSLFQGALGSTIMVPNRNRGQGEYMVLDYEFPDNFHEFDILILDLNSVPSKSFERKDHILPTTRKAEVMQLYCRFPTTVFDPRPLVSTFMAKGINDIQGRAFLQIIFASETYSVEYEPVLITGAFHETQDKVTRNIYDFWPNIPLGAARSGKEVTTCEVNAQLSSFLKKFNKDFRYKQSFYHPNSWKEKGGSIPDPNFTPLLENINHEIVAFSCKQENIVSFVFPDVVRKAEFLAEFLQEIAPTFLPEIFPYSTEFKWLEEAAYYLPGHQAILEEKEKLKKAFEIALSDIERRLGENTGQYSFLHQLVTETGSDLVKAVHHLHQIR